MKKILLVFALLSLSVAVNAQEFATTEAPLSLADSKKSGTYVFDLPEEVTTAHVQRSQQYYTDYFTITFDEATHKATIVLTKNEEMNRHVIIRFLKSVGVDEIKTGTESLENELFYQKYLK